MLIPEFWAEASARHRAAGKQVTVRRFGWSQESAEAAASHAQVRADEALARLLAGDTGLPRREPKVPYNGAEGVPIREQVLARHGETVITRNSYGAQCLNTPDALFADIDFQEEPEPGFVLPVTGVLVLAGAWLGKSLAGWGLALLFMFIALLASWSVAKGLMAMRRRASGGPEQLALTRLKQFLQTHRDWQLRLYRTPAGFRTLAMHRRFATDDPEVAAFFRAVRADKVYARMCERQRCFRARVSPKPWRIGLSSHLKPRPGVWPVDPERWPERLLWIADYEQRATVFASCRYLETLGEGAAAPDLEAVRELHDRLCRAESELPLA
jgi:hypothetical protein